MGVAKHVVDGKKDREDSDVASRTCSLEAGLRPAAPVSIRCGGETGEAFRTKHMCVCMCIITAGSRTGGEYRPPAPLEDRAPVCDMRRPRRLIPCFGQWASGRLNWAPQRVQVVQAVQSAASSAGPVRSKRLCAQSPKPYSHEAVPKPKPLPQKQPPDHEPKQHR